MSSVVMGDVMLMWRRWSAAGADREPELLQHVFACLSSLFRHLVRHLAADLAAVLARTGRLRYHRAEHVRRLAAQSTAFLFRHAGQRALQIGVRAVFAGEPCPPVMLLYHNLFISRGKAHLQTNCM